MKTLQTLQAKKTRTMSEGFTLIELLLAIGIISILSSIIISAISPRKQLVSARDAERQMSVKQMNQALMQALINTSVIPGGGTIPVGVANAKPICRTTISDAECTTAGGANISSLVPTFLAQLPIDVVMQDTSNCTGYMVYQEAGRMFVTNPNLGKLSGDTPAAGSDCGDTGGGATGGATGGSTGGGGGGDDTTPPTMATLSPLDNATNVPVSANFVISFSEPVHPQAAGSTNIYIKKDVTNEIVATIPAQSAQVTGSGTTTITINPTNDLDVLTDYYIQIEPDAFDDLAGNSFAGIRVDTNDTTTWNFTTTPGVTFYPPDNYDSFVPSGTLSIIFDKDAVPRAGANNLIRIIRAQDGVIVSTIDPMSIQLWTNGSNTIYFNPSSDLEFGTDYYVHIGPDAFDFTDGTDYPGISDNTTWNFKTEPEISSTCALSCADTSDCPNGTSCSNDGSTCQSGTCSPSCNEGGPCSRNAGVVSGCDCGSFYYCVNPTTNVIIGDGQSGECRAFADTIATPDEDHINGQCFENAACMMSGPCSVNSTAPGQAPGICESY